MILKRKSNKKRLNSIVLPFLFFAINERLGKAIIIVLIVIILILLVYLVYLFIEVKKEKEVKVEKKEEIKISEEQPIVTKKIEKEVVQQPIVIEKKKEIEPVIIKEVKEEPKEELIIDNGLYIRYNYSFVARMHQAPKESQERFSEIKNYLLSYEGVTVRKSWRNERFMYQGKPIAKFWIHGNILDAYLNLDYEMLKDTKYEVEDLRGKRLHENTPVLFKVVGSRTLDYLKELIDMYMESVGGVKGEEQNIDYTVPYISKEELLKKDLIKVNYNK
ncbi:hypothetical protein [Haploplasma axanthum]|uniref:Uncharacterized protein n=1 Tax=Haploplasma axanthum TaxID=29552 RepID=A0A449BBK8_HAPAX|nr:hypothetical protein [Haploplasma axanthum]VEU79825.1 Uncharacterised protein [Haploplasma axanthum]